MFWFGHLDLAGRWYVVGPSQYLTLAYLTQWSAFTLRSRYVHLFLQLSYPEGRACHKKSLHVLLTAQTCKVQRKEDALPICPYSYGSRGKLWAKTGVCYIEDRLFSMMLGIFFGTILRCHFTSLACRLMWIQCRIGLIVKPGLVLVFTGTTSHLFTHKMLQAHCLHMSGIVPTERASQFLYW